MTARTVAMGRRMWEQARRDLEAARRLLSPGTYYVAENLAHQAAEKSLKAAHWHLLAEEPAWKHRLGSIADKLADEAGEFPAEVRSSVAQLMPLFEISRYPSGNLEEPIPADLIGEEDATAAITSAEVVMTWVQTLLQRPAGKAKRKTS